MTVTHGYALARDRLKPLQLVIFAAALLVDFVNFWIFVGGCAARSFLVWVSAGIFFALLGVRCAALGLTVELRYDFRGETLEITRRRWRRRVVCRLDRADIAALTPFAGKSARDRADLRTNDCGFQPYMVELNDGKRLILSLDEFMYVLLHAPMREEA